MSRVFSKELVADVACEMKVADLQNATIQTGRTDGNPFYPYGPGVSGASGQQNRYRG